MVRKIDWDVQIGRRLKMRDLHVFLTIVQCGSMVSRILPDQARWPTLQPKP